MRVDADPSKRIAEEQTMSEKPGKRLVGKREYLRVILNSKKGALLMNSWIMMGLSAFYCVAAFLGIVLVLMISLLTATGHHPDLQGMEWTGANAVFFSLLALNGTQRDE